MLELRPSPGVPGDVPRAGDTIPYENVPALRRSGRRLLPQGSDALLLVAVLAFAITLLVLLPKAFNDDTWLALVAGRDIWTSGLPHHETLTVMSHGHRWVDQQWLAQLMSYAVYRVGGLGLLGLVNVALMASSVGAAVIIVRRRRARAWLVMATLALCLTQIVPFGEVRTQAFAMPLIVATVALVSADSRRHSTRVYWCLPILVLWANVHGTAAIGAAIVSVYGLLFAAQRIRTCRALGRSWRAALGPLALIFGPPICILLTPYGFGVVGYYQSTLANGAFKQLVTEWQPITSQMAIAIPFFLLAALIVWSFGRAPGATTMWEKVVLLVLGFATIMVLRNGLLFAFAALIIAPCSLDTAIPRRAPRNAPLRGRVNAALAGTAVVLLVVVAGSTIAQRAKAFEYHFQRPGLLAVVRAETTRYRSLKVFSDVRYADWLLWEDPGLRGRVAYDASFELLSASEMKGIVRVLSVIGTQWKHGATGYRLVVLDRTSSADAVQGFLHEPGHRILYQGGGQIVILRSASAAA